MELLERHIGVAGIASKNRVNVVPKRCGDPCANSIRTPNTKKLGYVCDCGLAKPSYMLPVITASVLPCGGVMMTPMSTIMISTKLPIGLMIAAAANVGYYDRQNKRSSAMNKILTCCNADSSVI